MSNFNEADRDTLMQLSMTALVETHNKLADEASQAGPKTFSSKKKAVDRILKLSTEVEPTTEPESTIDEKTKAKDKATAEKLHAMKAKKAETKSGRPIRVAAEELILTVVHEQDGRQYGMPYLDILEALKEEFPESQTSVACLRWYAVQLRERFRGTFHKVPDRPRPPKKPAVKQ